MATMCVCGRYIYSTSANPWSSNTLDEQGRVIGGTCVHGVHFPLQLHEANIKGKGGIVDGNYKSWGLGIYSYPVGCSSDFEKNSTGA